jgi:antitoxin component of MazEF toxin-antitoxin module
MSPLVRRIINLGKNSKGVILPKSWLEFYERQSRQSIKEVSMEVNGRLIIQPIFREERQ